MFNEIGVMWLVRIEHTAHSWLHTFFVAVCNQWLIICNMKLNNQLIAKIEPAKMSTHYERLIPSSIWTILSFSVPLNLVFRDTLLLYQTKKKSFQVCCNTVNEYFQINFSGSYKIIIKKWKT